MFEKIRVKIQKTCDEAKNKQKNSDSKWPIIKISAYIYRYYAIFHAKRLLAALCRYILNQGHRSCSKQ